MRHIHYFYSSRLASRLIFLNLWIVLSCLFSGCASETPLITSDTTIDSYPLSKPRQNAAYNRPYKVKGKKYYPMTIANGYCEQGVTIGKYNYKVIKQRIFFPDLPDAFDGFTITQISDVHSGSFDNPEKINYAIDLVNEQNSDMILFTGDIVNTDAKEMHPWIETFNRIKKHEYGKYSVLGNHDYGEYITWPSEAAKEDNFKAIKDLYGQIGFKLMLNEHTFIEKGDAKIALVGVENWGHNFKKAGDLNKASGQLKKEDFKILMSHDPSHWEHVVQHDDKHYHLTLSGHTHGMQFGIEIPGYFKWSLAQYVYKQWAGLYENVGRYVYVNRGFGFHAYPGRVGIMPEITVIELKKGVNVA